MQHSWPQRDPSTKHCSLGCLHGTAGPVGIYQGKPGEINERVTGLEVDSKRRNLLGETEQKHSRIQQICLEFGF
jgi:hypothetical protein